MTLLLDVRNLGVVYDTPRGSVVALDGVNLALESGRTLGVVGESGSGKSTLGLAVGRLMPENARRLSGDLGVLGTSVFGGDRRASAPLASRRAWLHFPEPHGRT